MAVAIPISIANARLAGLAPEVGLYASILPLIAYALLGTSPQLVVGPTAAIAVLVASGIAPLAGDDRALYSSLAVTLAFMTGAFTLMASVLRMGKLADFLSRPILVGYLNGTAVVIAVDQLAVLLGVRVQVDGTLPRLLELARRVGEAHMPTVAVGAGTLVLLALVPRVVPRVPAALVAVVVAGIAVSTWGLDRVGVTTLGPVPSGFPSIRTPSFPLALLPTLLAEAIGLTLVSVANTMIAARSFAERGGHRIRVDREVAALGTAQLAAAIAQSFPVSGANTRTAVAVAAGARTRGAGLITAGSMAVVLVFFTSPLRYVPNVALAAVLLMASKELFQWAPLAAVRRNDRGALWLALFAMSAVIAFGAMQALLLIGGAALLDRVRRKPQRAS